MSISDQYIDILIFVVFLCLNAVVGWKYRGKTKSFKEYAIGDKKFSTATLTATIVATWMSGSYLFTILEETYTRGLYYINAAILGNIVGLLTIARAVGPRMGRFLDCVSMPEALGKLYGKQVQVISGICCVLQSIGYIAVQFKIMAKILIIIFNYDSPAFVYLAATIVTLYSLSGGVKAVTFTDVLQFFTFGTLLPVLALTVWNNLEDHGQVAAMLKSNPHFSLKEVFQWSPEFVGMFVLFSYYILPELAPEMYQRVTMANSPTQVKHSMTWATFICSTLGLCVAWIAILVLTDHPGMRDDEVVPYLVNTHVPTGLKGFLGVGVLALAMSTADSTINSTAVITSNDVVAPLRSQKEGSLRAAKIATLFLGAFAVWLALYVKGILDIILLSACFYTPVVLVPMLLAIFGFQTSKRVVLMAMGTGAVTVTAFLIIFRNADSFFPGMLANLVVMLGAHSLLKEKGGWQPLDPTSSLALERAARKKAWRRRLQALKSFKLTPYLQQNLPVQESLYFLFGLYALVATYAAFYTIDRVNNPAYPMLAMGIYYAVLPITTALLTVPIWPKHVRKSKFMAYFWPLSIGGVLFFVGSCLTIMSDFHHMYMMIMMINLLITLLVFPGFLAFLLVFLGTTAAMVLLYATNQSAVVWSLSTLGTLEFKTTYGLLLFTSLLIVLFRSKAVYQQLVRSYELLRVDTTTAKQSFVEALHYREELLENIQVDKIEALHTIKQLQQQLEDELKSATETQKLDIFKKQINTTGKKLQKLIDHMSQALQQAQTHLHLVVDNVDLSALLDRVFSVLSKQEARFPYQVLTHQNSTQTTLQVDVDKIKQLFVEGLYYAWKHKQENYPVTLSIEDTLLGYPIASIQDYVKKVKALQIVITSAKTLPEQKDLYMGSTDGISVRIPKNSDELPLMENQQIVDAHYGVSTILEEECGITQIYVIPVRVREVRPQTMDLLHTAEGTSTLGTTIDPTEQELIGHVQKTTRVDMVLFQKAIQLAKKYHAGVTRKTGEPFYLHPIAVARILLDYTQDQDTLLAALLHDIVEDTKFSLARVALHFNTDVSKIVDGVTHLDSRLKSFKRVQLSMDENIRQLLGIKDERILYVKLADRLHNMRTIRAKSPKSQQNTTRETLLFYVPMAEKLSLTGIAEELRRLCTAVLDNPK
mmetsp:Transcript_9505/g.21810  ORF Transcript_9505/g.21810 Transcript_9505/m.21810 type:complete len:1159 (-) Transcript_9505:3061-6537(-)